MPTNKSIADCLTLAEFLERENLSRAHWRRLQDAGLAPTTKRIGVRVVIEIAEADRWHLDQLDRFAGFLQQPVVV